MPMSKRKREPAMRALRNGLIITIITIFGLEGLLQVTDPIGVNAYAEWLHFTQRERLPADSGYIHPAGTYTIAGDTITIDGNGYRHTPQPDSPRCTVALIGDSVAFGVGVSDEDTFAHDLAAAYPDAAIINLGRQGYNNTNLQRSLDEVQADRYIYLLVNNDYLIPTTIYPVGDRLPLSISLHLRFLRKQQLPEGRRYMDRFITMLEAMQSRPVTTFTYNDSEAADIAGEYLTTYPITVGRAHTVSVADSHPDAIGHAMIAEQMTAVLGDDVCIMQSE